MGERIVLVEDDDADQHFFSKAIDRCGIDVDLVMCETAAQARTAVDGVAPDLVVADLNLPGGNGMGLLRELKNEHPTLPVVVLTSSTAPWDHRDAIDSGCRAVHTKPFDWIDYRHLIERMLKYWLANDAVVGVRPD